MSHAELRDKFDQNAEGFLRPEQRDRLAAEIQRLESLPIASALLDLVSS